MNANITALKEQKSSGSTFSKVADLFSHQDYGEVIRTLAPLVKTLDVNKPQSEIVTALTLMADAQRFKGLYDDAYQNYTIAIGLDPARKEAVEANISHCLPKLKTRLNDSQFEAQVINYLEAPSFQNRYMEKHVSAILMNRYDLSNDEANIEFNDLVTDPLLLLGMKKMVLVNPHIEKLIIDLRGQIFQLAVENGIPSALAPIILALAEHSALVEYALPINEDERILLLGIKTLMETHIESEQNPVELLEPLLLYLMFEPISSVNLEKETLDKQIEHWPETVQPLFKLIISDALERDQLATTIPSLNTVQTDVSRQVMAQYEQNPYPQWRDVFSAKHKVPYLSAHEEVQPLVKWQDKFSAGVKCLIAGCGTGLQVNWLAANTKDVEITALDLSVPSLSYGKHKAISLGLADNIHFVQGDILGLEATSDTYDAIECTGVLHHLEDPELGLQILVSKLRQHGLLKLALYSRTARESLGINAARAEEPAITLNEIRDQRQKYFSNLDDPMLKLRDFYMTSECRDLLSHVQEHQFDCLQLQELLSRQNLQFLGFRHLPQEVMIRYKRQFQDDPEGLNLSNWHEFEQANPFTFSSMYQFYCQHAG